MVLKIVKKDEEEFDRWIRKQYSKAAEKLIEWGIENPRELLSTEIGWLLCLPKIEERPLEFDLFQVRFLTTKARRRSVLKARQVGFSFEIGAECVARCHLKDRHTAVCVSYNLDDAKEKIQRVKELHDELPLEYQKKVVIDSKTEVGFAANNSRRRISRVISYPSKAPRGKSGDVYLDELAHCQNDRTIYSGATALVVRSGGQLSMGSTPLGRRGVFHAVHTQEFEKYPGVWRQEIPWWLCRQFCKDIPSASQFAKLMPTEERVERYGTADLVDQFRALPIEDFQQEFELAFQDERVSFYSYDLILPCCQRDRSEFVHDDFEAFCRELPRLGPLYAGFDVGRHKHPSELHIFDKQGPLYTLRYELQFRDVSFPDQRARMIHLVRALGDNLKKLRVDATGLGKNLAEDLQKEFGPRKIEMVTFSNPVKTDLANALKVLFEERNIVLPKDRGLVSQIHSIKQKITVAGNSIFDVEKNRYHHADKLWSIALATYRKNARRQGPGVLGVRTIGEPAPGLTMTPGGILVPSRDMGLVEALFTPPQRAAAKAIDKGDASADALDLAPLEAIEKRARAVQISMRVWARSGDEDRVREYSAEYRALRRAILRRRKAEGLPESLDVIAAEVEFPHLAEEPAETITS